MTTKDTSTVPAHVGLILDGNRRWAKEHGLKTIDGHKQGYKVLKEIAREAFERGVDVVSAYVFSTENWKRAKQEVGWLMKFAAWAAENEVDELARDGIRLRVLGREEGVPKALIRAIHRAEQLLKNNHRGTVALCFNYGGQLEIVDAVRQLVNQGKQAEQIDEAAISSALYAPDLPPVDLVIRTSGEQRLSNFMLWRVAYSEFYFSKKYWPDFSVADFRRALNAYATRQRRFRS